MCTYRSTGLILSFNRDFEAFRPQGTLNLFYEFRFPLAAVRAVLRAIDISDLEAPVGQVIGDCAPVGAVLDPHLALQNPGFVEHPHCYIDRVTDGEIPVSPPGSIRCQLFYAEAASRDTEPVDRHFIFLLESVEGVVDLLDRFFEPGIRFVEQLYVIRYIGFAEKLIDGRASLVSVLPGRFLCRHNPCSCLAALSLFLPRKRSLRYETVLKFTDTVPDMSFRIGAHVSISGGVEKAVERQEEIGGNCGQIFAGSPRTWSVAEYSQEEGEDFQELRNEKDQDPYVIHSTYLVNLATPKDDLFEKSLGCLQAELEAASTLGVEYVVFHPGAHTGSGRENGIERIAEGIDDLEIPEGVTLLLENTAGKGTTLGKSFGELRQMIEKAGTPEEKLGVCIDTCHAHAAGYDLRSEKGFQDMIQEIEEDLGLETVKVVHLNDSKDGKGSEKDNHQHIGRGEIGDEGFRNVVNSRLSDKPMVLETPVTEDRGYSENLQKIMELRE